MFIFFLSLYLLTMHGPKVWILEPFGGRNPSGVTSESEGSLLFEMGGDDIVREYYEHGSGKWGLDGLIVSNAADLLPKNMDEEVKYYLLAFIGLSLVPIAGALCVLVTFLLVRRLGYGEKAAVWVSMIFGLCTMVWAASATSFPETIQTLALLCAVYFALIATASDDRADRIAASAVSGFAAVAMITTEPLLIVILPMIVIYFVAAVRAGSGTGRSSKLDAIVSFAIGAGLCDLLLRGVWIANTIDAFNINETSKHFSTPILTGLYGLLFSPGKSIFLYSPVIIAGLFGARAFHREHRRESILFWFIIVALLLLWSKWWSWHGGSSWGPRHLLPCVPLLVIMMSPLLKRFGGMRFAAKAAIIALAALSFAIQIPGVAIDSDAYTKLVLSQAPYNSFYAEGGRLRDTQLVPHFIPEFSPIAGHAWLLKYTLKKHFDPGLDARAAMTRDYPWRTLLRSTPPPEPQVALGLAFWHSRLPRPGMFPQAGSWALPLRNFLAASCLLSLLVLLFSIGKISRKVRNGES